MFKRVVGILYAILIVCAGTPDRGVAQPRPKSLTLQQPRNIFVVPDMNANRQWFNNYIFWEGAPDSLATYIHQPDTTGWRAPGSPTNQDSLSVPISSGVHTGSIDRTVSFRALEGGRVGQAGRIRIRYEIVSQENFNRILDVGNGYVPNDPINCIFINEVNGDTLDLGLKLEFTPGLVDSNGVFVIGMEDFEGFHVWRAIEPDGSDMVVLGELSKQEEFAGSEVDALYFNEIIPALRRSGFYIFPFPVPGLGGTVLDITGIHPNGRLGPNEFAWFDFNAFNGFTYYYGVTSYDRGYNVKAHSQGLNKFDNCPVAEGLPFPCASDTTLIRLNADVTPQNNLKAVYAVPNPYRSGSSQFTTPNYHNFPDNKVRFVNVPGDCRLRIYTVAGDFVHELVNAGGPGNLEWDTRNSSGQLVGSGAYIFRCEARSGDGVYGRLIIIR